jgi:hypothetical protein
MATSRLKSLTSFLIYSSFLPHFLVKRVPEAEVADR